MGVYIPNMEKPKDCDLCPFADLFGICKDDCPLIEIVTCGECKYLSTNYRGDSWCGGTGSIVDPTDFCSYGERRADDD